MVTTAFLWPTQTAVSKCAMLMICGGGVQGTRIGWICRVRQTQNKRSRQQQTHNSRILQFVLIMVTVIGVKELVRFVYVRCRVHTNSSSAAERWWKCFVNHFIGGQNVK